VARLSRSKWIDDHLPYLLLIPAFTLVAIISVAPSAYSVYLSFTKYNIDIYPHPVWAGLTQYIFMFTKDIFISQTISVTIEWVAVVMTLNYSFALILALLMNQRGLRLKAYFRVLFMVSFAVPITAVWPIWVRILTPSGGLLNVILAGIGLENSLHPIEWLNSYPLLTVAGVGLWSGFAFGAIALLAALQGIPMDQYEAIKLDGAGRLNVFRYIEWPHLMKLNVILWMLGVVAALNNFNIIYVMTGGGPGFATTTLYLYAYRELTSGDYAYTSAIATLLFAVEMVVAVFYVRYVWLGRK
jgi:multiple sugar transport system permease protein